MSFKKQVYKAQAGNPQHQVVPMADLIKPQKQPSYTPIAEAFDLEPIPDLKPGENLRWKSPQHKNLRWPALDQTLTVKSVVLPSLSRSPYDPLMRGLRVDRFPIIDDTHPRTKWWYPSVAG